MIDNRSQPTRNLVQEYKPTDVLSCGRGWKLTFDHQGNRIFRKTIESHMAAYTKLTSQKERSLFFSAVNEELKASGCRFLKRLDKQDDAHHPIGGEDDESCWEVLSDQTTRCKISHAFRDKLHRNKVNAHTLAKRMKIKSTSSVQDKGESGDPKQSQQINTKVKHVTIIKPQVFCSKKVHNMEDVSSLQKNHQEESSPTDEVPREHQQQPPVLATPNKQGKDPILHNTSWTTNVSQATSMDKNMYFDADVPYTLEPLHLTAEFSWNDVMDVSWLTEEELPFNSCNEMFTDWTTLNL